MVQWPNCTAISGGLALWDGPSNRITDLSGIANIESCAALSLTGLQQLSNFNDLHSSFTIVAQSAGPWSGTRYFEALYYERDNFIGLESINPDQIYIENSEVTSLLGLEGVTGPTTRVNIFNNPLLLNLNGFNNVLSFGDLTNNSFDRFTLYDNVLLSDISAISGSDLEHIEISNNFSLSNCSISSICAGIQNGRVITIRPNNFTGCNSIAEVQAACQAPLPVELISFQALPSTLHNSLTWQTASEENASLFRIQRSIDAEKWQELNIVQAAGESSQLQSYSYLDKSAPEGVSYYRLVMEDLDGTQEYSEVVSVIRGEVARPLEAFPNPTSGLLSLSGVAPDASVRVYGLLGKVVIEGTLQQGQLDLSGLPSGIYGVGVGDEVIRIVVE